MSNRNLNSDTQRHRRQLAAWLYEWESDQRLRAVWEAVSTPPSDFSASVPGCISGPRIKPKPGLIVLLPPLGDLGPAERPFYVLILEEQVSGAVLAAPFSRFPVPSEPGEWQTGLRAGPLRVLCLWNTRVFPRFLVEAGYQSGQLSQQKLAQAFEVYRILYEEGSFRSVSHRAVGPPLRHPLDPRHAYKHEESEALDAILNASVDLGLPPMPLRCRGPLIYSPPIREKRQAAEGKTEYNLEPQLETRKKTAPSSRTPRKRTR